MSRRGGSEAGWALSRAQAWEPLRWPPLPDFGTLRSLLGLVGWVSPQAD